MKKIITILTLAIITASCNMATENINVKNDKKIAAKGLTYQDFQEVADKAIDSLLRSGVLTNPRGTKYILAISDVKNDTMQNIDTDQLIKKIRVALSRSGKVKISNSIGIRTDRMIKQLRKLRNHQEYNQKTVVGHNQLKGADLSLFGRIIQKNIAISKGREQIEYYFQLTLTSIVDGLSIWEDEIVLGKRADGDSVSW
jgi:uncharacterized protein (TIGR02722 family)